MNPSTYANKLTCLDGSLNFTCPSKTDPEKYHNVQVCIINGNVLFQCDCSNGFDGLKSQSCCHIEAILVNLCGCFVLNACNFVELKDKHIKIKHTIDDLKNKVSNLSI